MCEEEVVVCEEEVVVCEGEESVEGVNVVCEYGALRYTTSIHTQSPISLLTTITLLHTHTHTHTYSLTHPHPLSPYPLTSHYHHPLTPPSSLVLSDAAVRLPVPRLAGNDAARAAPFSINSRCNWLTKTATHA